MAKPSTSTNRKTIKHVVKLTSQGGRRAKTSAFNKSEKRSHKAYRGQGR
jgi:hypothetical protein